MTGERLTDRAKMEQKAFGLVGATVAQPVRGLSMYDISSAIVDLMAEARKSALEEAEAIARKYECRKQKVCCKMQLWSVGQEIQELAASPAPEDDG